MDPELKTMLSALVEGQIKLAEAQAEMAHGQDELRKVVARVVGRIDWFGEQVVRGFTRGVAVDRALDQRVTRLERQFSAFKKSRKKPRKH